MKTKMKTKIYDTRASQDIKIDELPKQDNPNNSDLLVIQGASLTEATSIQQLRNKILGGEAQLREDLGSLLFASAPITSPDYILMDGTEYTQTQYPIFYDWLLEQLTSIQTKFNVDTVAGTFRVPNYINQIPYVANSDNAIPPYYAVTNPTLITNSTTVFGTYCYIKVNYEGASTIASPYIKTDGSVAMDLEYTPTDMNDVVTKKYVEDRLLNYELPLSFSLNDIGKRVPYYKNASNNPTLIALDGTKYLIEDYPDFDYANQEGFANDGKRFWFANIELELKHFQNDIQPSSEWFKLPVYDQRPKGESLQGNFEFKSKMIYNFLNSPQGAPYLFPNDIFGVNAENNACFTIVAPADYKIRANYNNWGWISDGDVAPGKKIYKYKMNGNTYFNDSITNTYRFAVTLENQGNLRYFGAVGEVSYLKIKPDYMVAKIQQVGNVNGGDVKSDRSVLLTGTGTFNTKQVASMDDLTSQNIRVGDSAKALITLDTKLNEVDNSISTINNSISTINNNINNINNSIGSVDISGLQSQVDTNTSSISGVQSQVDTNTTDIANIKTVNTNQDSSISNLQNQVNTNTSDIANINVILLTKQPLLINIPILSTRVNSNLVQNVLLGAPTILGLTGYNVDDYVSVANNIIKLKNTNYKIVNLSGSVLANYVDNNGNLVTTGTKYYQVFFRRPSTVTVAGTNANDILNTAFDIKSDNVSIADCEYTFSDTFSSGSNDPFNIDGFVFSISNSTNTNIQTILNRTGYAKKSFIRIRLG